MLSCLLHARQSIHRPVTITSTIFPHLAFYSFKSNKNVDFSRVPKLSETDLEESLVRGNGPGGQAVNKTSNCVMLRHKPTNIIVKCHIHRVTEQNRKEARNMLIAKLDTMVNGEYSVQNQLKAIGSKKGSESDRKRRKLNEMKQKWKEREMETKAEGDVD